MADRGLLFLAALFLTAFACVLDMHDAYRPAIASLLLVTIVLSVLCDGTNLFQVAMVGSHYTFLVAPALVFYLTGIAAPVVPMAMCVVGVAVAIFLTANGPRREAEPHPALPLSSFLALLAAATVLMVATSGGSMLYTTVLVLVAFAITIERRPLATSLFVAALVAAHLAAYALLYWSGTGRLIVFGYVLATALILIRNHPTIPIGKWTIFGLMALGSGLGSVYRFGAASFEDALAAMSRDSNTSPLLLLSEIYATSGAFTSDFAGWLDQLTLFFLTGVPRTLWPDKPNGFGYQYTVDNLPQNLADSAHSVATTFVGEHVYYLGPWLGVAGMLLAVGLVCLLYRLLSRPSILGGHGVIAVAVWAPTFYWGGMASFSARFSLSVAPLILLHLLHQWHLATSARKAQAANG